MGQKFVVAHDLVGVMMPRNPLAAIIPRAIDKVLHILRLQNSSTVLSLNYSQLNSR